ncbi:MAG TPA: L,D-transpeptidase [Caulobacteraceae bacterium]|nr:L,D-transpeptidase [Caulobacteraceae bacterium]
MLRLRMRTAIVWATALALAAAPALAQPPPDQPAEPNPAPAAPPSAPGPAEPGPPPELGPPLPPIESQQPSVEAPSMPVVRGPAPEQVTAEEIEAAALPAGVPAADPALLVKLQVLLDRAHNSPGAIDGRPGRNLDHALGIYAHEHNLEPGLNTAVVASLQNIGGGAITQSYTITANDEAGPFIGRLPSDFYAQSKLGHMGYTSAEQELAERFHMSQQLLEAMNPGADFSKPGTQLTVVSPHTGGLHGEVAKIAVDKRDNQVMAYGAGGQLIASFPSTIGSAEHPAPSGDYSVAQIRPHPVYIYDPRVLTWGPRRHGRFRIASGPNNPTGVVWIGLSKPTYGIHGSPNAELIGKTSSHGCVRLTNWDAWDLGNAVKPGAAVAFLGQGPQKTAAQDRPGGKT